MGNYDKPWSMRNGEQVIRDPALIAFVYRIWKARTTWSIIAGSCVCTCV